MHSENSANGSETQFFEVQLLSLFFEGGLLAPAHCLKGSTAGLATVALGASILTKEDIVWMITMRTLHRQFSKSRRLLHLSKLLNCSNPKRVCLILMYVNQKSVSAETPVSFETYSKCISNIEYICLSKFNFLIQLFVLPSIVIMGLPTFEVHIIHDALQHSSICLSDRLMIFEHLMRCTNWTCLMGDNSQTIWIKKVQKILLTFLIVLTRNI